MDTLRIETWKRKDCTIGILTYKKFTCVTLELPWLCNKRNVSCIPRAAGYVGRKHKSPANGDCIAIDRVLDRDHIQIHSLNWLHQTEGCIGVGKLFNPISHNGPMITNSRDTLKKLLSILPDVFTVEIV